MTALEDGDMHTLGSELPAMFDGMKLAAVATVLYIVVRCLNLKSPTSPPEIINQDTAISRYLHKTCPLLTKEYIPPLLWGKSGHLQTVLYGKMGRVNTPSPCGVRKFLPMQDGATATFDLFEALGDHSTGDDVTMVICPGIGNHSEKNYIRTFVDHSQRQGYRCAVLNHLGALPNVELTSPRIFTYGCTWEYAAMVGYIKRAYPQTLLVAVGFSLGGNIVCKFLGENHANQDRVLCGVSICQGYSALRTQETFVQWDQCRKFYNFVLTDNMKKLILSHRSSLLSMSSSNIGDADLNRLYAATSLIQIDDTIMRKFHSHSSLKEYYEKESCVHYIHKVTVPLLLVNSSDDPLVHQSLLDIPRNLAEKMPNVIFVLTQHGGHLGFFEGAMLFPQPLTWMDKFIVEYTDAICRWEQDQLACRRDTHQSTKVTLSG
ncbi:monoacylglycerol lipase ABHD2-B-like isoform X1 [Echeneis naucrates]|uniref:Monoacylglycerol lipase ABHD2 n=1 Tax=Echeneis naucrates TaxID=173247 RepID=A0A665TN41_ECHNA|nr:monoacylglycerol lipase ABHD2-B-like isoform X1 [Echeneis naucrates]XP_029378998.1 monoacylglycerol lipase ABHD2-B-like isoform X1 [Echeneis naucrates]XP_029378999.1 monoacylglycerol lipase ABHD2-B-like isoform X1 [Echeneis naucrates]XP_029379001.1 monoacylglycerol lipase ABHD2-B-like isoform X1 [Echeneis naucrates]XP_029379002.1 monoacylglycerol lipase ABHD2-B-like isoform X1 [Echeneis naucrates]XP_029379003.1 monoacylglycerol lipase ABHD2-B-like isoform X1 [Echeneis naucrates]XP_02937900